MKRLGVEHRPLIQKKRVFQPLTEMNGWKKGTHRPDIGAPPFAKGSFFNSLFGVILGKGEVASRLSKRVFVDAVVFGEGG